MKTCSLCHLPKPEAEFNRSKGRKDGLQTKCRVCSGDLSRVYYSSNKTRLGPITRARNKERKRANQEQLFEYLAVHPCVDCGEPDPVVLEFDHVRGSKRDQVTRMAELGLSWSTIEEEIAKCQVRCCNCHRRKTSKERNHFRSKYFGVVQRQDNGL
jgi:hypothetical protein